MIVLRPDQLALKQGIYTGWNSGKRNMLGVLPTGGGKSIIVSDINVDFEMMRAQQVVIAHRKELVGQMSLHVARRGIQHRIIGAKQTVSQITNEHRLEFGRSFVNPSALCTVASVDTILANKEDLRKWGAQQSFWTIDEGHHVLRKNKWGECVSLFSNAIGLGVTATPGRADGQGLGSHADGVYDDMVIGPSPRELMNIGAITDYEYVCPPSDFHIDESDFAESGDLSPKKGREASKRSHIVGDVVKEYVKYAFGKRAIAFATDVETAGEIAEKFNAIGIPAAAVSAKTPDHVRDDYIRRFKNGQYWILVNVDLFGEGFDVPAVEVVIMARPTASLAVFLQQCGRALRAFLGKTYGLIIDHVENYKRHGWPDKPRYWTLDRREKRAKKEKDPEEIELRVCKACNKPFERVKVICPHCDAAVEVTQRDRMSLEAIDGDLILLDRAKLAELRAATQLEAPGSLGERVMHVAGAAAAKARIDSQIERINSQQQLQYAIAVWAAHQRAMGREDQESYRRFYLTAGVDVLTAQTLSRADMVSLTEKIEGWIK